MKQIALAALLALSACQTMEGPVSPAPLAQTTVDEKSLILALNTFDTVLSAVDRLVMSGVIKAGSPLAMKISDQILLAKTAFQAALAAQQAGSTTNFTVAVTQAQTAIAEIGKLIGG